MFPIGNTKDPQGWLGRVPQTDPIPLLGLWYLKPGARKWEVCSQIWCILRLGQTLTLASFEVSAELLSSFNIFLFLRSASKGCTKVSLPNMPEVWFPELQYNLHLEQEWPLGNAPPACQWQFLLWWKSLYNSEAEGKRLSKVGLFFFKVVSGCFVWKQRKEG